MSLPPIENAAGRVVDLQRCSLFASLSPEQLYSVARSCQTRVVGLEDIHKPLLDLEKRLVFVGDGMFERIYLPDQQSFSNPERAVVLQELTPGDIWGEHFVLSGHVDDQERLALRASVPGRFVALPASRFRHLLERWPSVQQALLDAILRRDLDQGLRLGAVKHQLDRTDLVLDRIDSVAEALLSGGDQRNSVQRKYLLGSVPTLTGRRRKVYDLEQAYLPGTRTREDRIRRKGENEYYRTSKFGSGIQRRQFDRRIDNDEYARLLANKEGRCIRKRRTHLESPRPGVELLLDEFQGEGNLKGLKILEAAFEDTDLVKELELPGWLQKTVDKEVTDDPRYFNRHLALHGLPEEQQTGSDGTI